VPFGGGQVDQAAIAQQDEIAKIASEAWDQAMADRRQDAADFSASKGLDAQAFLDREDLKAQSAIPLSMAMSMFKNEQGIVEEPWVKELQAAVLESREKAGGGLIGQLLFGDDTDLAHTYEKMDEFKQRTIDLIGEMSTFFASSAEATTGAVGQAIAAHLGEGKALGKSRKESLHQLTMGLSAQAAQKALWEGVQGAAGLLVGDPNAPLHLAAAAIYGGAAVAFGAAARATYSAPASTPATSSRSAPSYASGGSSGGGGGGGGGGDAPGITININGVIGDPVTIARVVGDAFKEYERQTGRKPN
jgi:hypothetical protein